VYFSDRNNAGYLLAHAWRKPPVGRIVVCGLARGGVIVASPLAKSLHAPLFPVSVKKIGHPGNPEYAVAAVTPDGFMFENQVETSQISREWLHNQRKLALAEISRREKLYQTDKSVLLNASLIVIVDDGVATGLTLLAAVRYIRSFSPEKIFVAVPVAPADFIDRLSKLVDKVICLEKAVVFSGSVGSYYASFPQVTDARVISALSS
jgi:predicted phosphoribosyltransferase